MKKNKLVIPVVKWVGGKRQLLPQLLKYIPDTFTGYYEPFIGGGALLFALQPKSPLLNVVQPLTNVIRRQFQKFHHNQFCPKTVAIYNQYALMNGYSIQ